MDPMWKMSVTAVGKVTTTEIEKLRSYMERVFAGFDQEVGEEDEAPTTRRFVGWGGNP